MKQKLYFLIVMLSWQLLSFAQTVSTFAGSGSAGFADGTGTAAVFDNPNSVAVDGAGNLYVTDTVNRKIRKITSTGVVSTFADLTATGTSIDNPYGIAVDGFGTVYVAVSQNNKIIKITSTGVVTTFAGSGAAGSSDGTGTAASFKGPNQIAVDSNGTVYVADSGNNKIRKITSIGVVTTLAGSGLEGSADGTGTAASFYYPSALAVDAFGNVYVADTNNHKIRKITSAGVVSTFAGSGLGGGTDGIGTAASFGLPYGVAVDGSGTVYVAEAFANKIRKITSAGVVTTFAGSGALGSADGVGTAATFYYPTDLQVDDFGNVYVVDTGSHKIRKIEPAPATHLNFDGVNDYVTLGSVITTGSSYTKEAMIKPNAVSGNYNILSSTGDVFWISNNTISAGHTNNFSHVTASASTLLNTWNHVAVTYDAPTTTMKLYVNGVMVSQNTNVPASAGNTIQIGAYANVALFNGGIDEVRIWNKALTGEEIIRRKNCELQGTETGLLAYYKFNHGAGNYNNASITSLLDATGNANGVFSGFELNYSTSNFSAGSPVISGIALPNVPTVISPISYNQNATATALTATGTGLSWYTVATGGTGSTTAPTPTTTTGGNTSYWVSSTNANGCESARVEIVVTTIVVAPAAPIAKTPQIYAGTATLAALTATGTNLQWYATATGGEPLEATTALVDGTTYYVSQTTQSVESLRTAVKAKKISEATQTLCSGATVASLITTPTAIQEVTTHWFTSATGGTALEGTAPLTSGDYYIEQRLPEIYTVASNLGNIMRITSDAWGNVYFLISENDLVTLKKINPDGTNVQTLVSFPYYPDADMAVDASGAIYILLTDEVKKMNNDGTNMQVLITDVQPKGLAIDAAGILYISTGDSIIKINSQGTIIDTFLLEPDTVVRDLDIDSYGNIYITSNSFQGIQKINSDGTFNQIFEPLSEAIFLTIDPSDTIYFFQVNYPFAILRKINNDGTNNQFIYSFTGLTLIEYALNGLYLSQYDSDTIKKLTQPYTSNRVKVTVIIEAFVTPPVTTPVTLTQDAIASALTATTEEAGVLWYTTATGGIGTTTAPTPDTTTPGNTSYWVSSTNANGCESVRAEIVVTVVEGLAGPVAQTPQIYAGTATIADLTATGNDLQWYADATGTETLELNTALVDGTTYYVSQTIESVESLRTAVQAKKISEATQTLCNGATVANLITTPSENGSIEWFATVTDGIALDETAVLESGSYYVEQTLLDNTSNRVAVTVVLDAVVATASVTTPLSYAQGATASALTAISGSVGLSWYATATGGTGSTTAPIPSTATVGTTSFWVTSTNANGCESARTEIVVNITQDVLTIGSHPSNANITGGQNTSFTAAVNGVTINYQWQVSHDGGSTFTDLTNDGIYSGVTSASLTLTNVPISMHGKQYKVKVSNGSEVVSNAAALAVTVPTFNNERFWKNRGTAGFSASDADYSVTALDANNMPYVAFADGANSDKATVMKFNGTSWDIVGTAGFSTSSNVYNFSIVFNASNMPYVAYVGGNNLIEVKHFNGTSWTNVGASGLGNQAEGLSFALDASGTPYVAFVDYGANYKTTVRKLVANAWVLVGNAGFTAGESYDTSFAIDEQGTPYVVYRDESNDGKATAMKFNGSAWVSVGPASGFSPDVAFYTSLSIDRAGTPYATFVDFYTDEPVVMKFNGSEWVMVGTPGFASGVLYSSSIALDGSGTPFVVYQDFDNNDKVTVKRFNGTSWTTVGEPGFSMGATTYTSLDVDASGTPYVGFIDASMGNKVTVMKFNGSNVETIWENGSWDNGVPSFTMKAIIDDTLVLSTDLQASALEVTTNGSITVATGTVLTVSGKIINNNTPAHFVVEDHGILLQQQDIQNEGPITVNVNSFPLYRQDYTLWSAPVKEQNLRSFSLQTLFNRFSSYNTAAGTGANPVGAYVQEIFTTADMATKTFTTANGYLIRMPNNWDDYVDNSIPGISYPGVFKGVPQNGAISRALSTSNTGMNLTGNPYPSPISIDAFFDGNPGVEQTIYYWRKRNDASGSGYATFNALGFVSAQSEINNLDMEYVINPGQGFFVKTTGATQLNFNNTMRSSNTDGLFLRNAPQEKHRLWLGLSNSTGSVGQTLIGYTAGATENADNGLDAAYFNDSATALTSLIDGNEYAIQGRSLPFSTTDSVPLGFKSATDGAYTIALSNFDGLFATEQAVFLKDNTTGSVTNLKLSDYSFTTPAGVFNSRFELRYDSTLNTNNPQDWTNQILIASKNNTITINAGTAIMEKIELYDVSGRLLFEKSGIDKSIETLENLTAANQVLLVKVTTQDKVSVTKKIVY